MDRRQFIGITFCAGISSVSGCLSLDDDEYATMQRLTLHNRSDDDPVTIEVKIEREDTNEIVHEKSYDISEDGYELVDCVWPDEALVVMTRRTDNDEDWNSFSTANEEGCLLVVSEVDDHGTAFLSAAEECPASFAECYTDRGE